MEKFKYIFKVPGNHWDIADIEAKDDAEAWAQIEGDRIDSMESGILIDADEFEALLKKKGYKKDEEECVLCREETKKQGR